MPNANEYLVFEADQVLTNDHLNQQFYYLDQQERWTRNKLIGIGIVCGLQLVQRPGIIEVTKGVGITSQGYLILLDTTRYTYYRPYAAVDQPKDLPFSYPGALPFFKPFCEEKTVYQLLSDDDYNNLENNEKAGAKTLTSAPANLRNEWVVVLFLELNEMDLKNCDAFDCNNRGEKMLLTIRALLVRKTDLPVRQPARTGAANGALVAPEPLLKRFNVPYTDLRSADDVINAFVRLVDDATLTSVATACHYCFQKYRALTGDNTDPFASLAADLRTRRDTIVAQFPPFIQYFYGLVDDLIKAYHEFLAGLSGLLSECCPDENRFPLHLVLGEATADTRQFEQDAFRQYFVYAPVFERRKSDLSETVFLFRRMQLMVENYLVQNPATNRQLPLRITPSRYEQALLSKRAIPYYYTPNQAGKELFRYWNYNKTLAGKANRNLGYNASLYSTENAVLQPLLYDIEPNNFFRIEGHIGQSYRTVLANLLQQRKTFNLPFDVVAVSADQLPLRGAPLPECNIQDLDTDYKLILSEFSCKAHTPFCYVTKWPFPPLRQVLTNTVNANATLLNYAAFKAEEVQAISLATLLRIGYRKGDFMRKFCKPTARTIGAAYLAALDTKGNFKNPIQQVNNQDPVSGLYYYLFEFIDAVEDLMKVLVPATIATLNIDDAVGKYKRCAVNTQRVIYVLARYLEGNNEQDWLKDLQLDLLIEEFSALVQTCLDERLQTLKEEYNRRFELYRLQLGFLTYYQKHPGLEHKAGVPKGGTFVLVYHTAPLVNRLPQVTAVRQPLTRTLESSLPSITRLAEGTVTNANLASLAATEATSLISPTMLNLIRRFVDDCDDAPEDRKKAVIDVLTTLQRPPLPAPRYQLPNNAVIADFYVPYLCCSDCPPVAYILPGEEPQVVVFDINPKEYLFDDQKNYPFTAQPPVEDVAQVTNPGPGPLNLLLKEGTLFLLPAMSIEATITRTLTYKEKSVSIRIIRPDATFTINLTKDAAGRPVVQVEAKQKDADSYEWKVNKQADVFQNVASPAPVLLEQLRSQLNNAKKVNIELTVSYTRNEQTSKDTKSDAFELESEVTVFDIQPKEFLYDESKTYPFTAKPAVTDLAQVNNPGGLNLSLKDGTLLLQPKMDLKATLKTTVAYKGLFLELTIIRPNAAFAVSFPRDAAGRTLLQLEAKDKGADDYQWTVNNTEKLFDAKPAPAAVILEELVRKIGAKDQLTVGLTLTYKRNDQASSDTRTTNLMLQACVDFEKPLVVGTTYGGQGGQRPGDAIFNTANINVRVAEFIFTNGGKTFGFAQIANGNLTGGDQVLRVNNVNLEFDFSKLGFETAQVTFDYFKQGGFENLVVNGDTYVGNLAQAKNTLGGVAVSVSEVVLGSGRRGTVLLKGAVKTLAIGGQEFMLDNVCAKV